MWHSDRDVELAVSRVICGKEDDKADKGSAFLISPTKAITATHNIIQYHHDNETPIRLEFLNLSAESPTIRYGTPIITVREECISIIELDEPVQCECLCFSNYYLTHGEDFSTFGYPAVKWDIGQWTKNQIARVLDGVYSPYDWDIDLDHSSNIEDFSGLSGAPLIVDGMLVGILLTETLENGKAISLGAVSTSRFTELLIENDIFISEHVTPELYEPEDDEYKDYLFIEKLESANIFEHEMCKKEFYSADMLNSIVESKKNKKEAMALAQLKRDVRSVWYTQYVGYKDKYDGGELLSSVYERVEDLDSTTLVADKKVSIYAKKGFLHEWAEKCKVGWVKNYQQRLIEYRKEKEQK